MRACNCATSCNQALQSVHFHDTHKVYVPRYEARKHGLDHTGQCLCSAATRAPHTSHSNNAGTGPTTFPITPQESEQGSQPGRSDSESTVNHAPSKLRSAPKGVHRAHTASKHTPTAPDCPKQHPQAYDIDASAEQQQLPTQLCNLAQPAALATAACTHSKPVRTPESATNLVSGHGVLSTSVGRIRRGYCHLPCCTCNL